jgi:hypothetical protein
MGIVPNFVIYKSQNIFLLKCKSLYFTPVPVHKQCFKCGLCGNPIQVGSCAMELTSYGPFWYCSSCALRPPGEKEAKLAQTKTRKKKSESPWRQRKWRFFCYLQNKPTLWHSEWSQIDLEPILTCVEEWGMWGYFDKKIICHIHNLILLVNILLLFGHR